MSAQTQTPTEGNKTTKSIRLLRNLTAAIRAAFPRGPFTVVPYNGGSPLSPPRTFRTAGQCRDWAISIPFTNRYEISNSRGTRVYAFDREFAASAWQH